MMTPASLNNDNRVHLSLLHTSPYFPWLNTQQQVLDDKGVSIDQNNVILLNNRGPLDRSYSILLTCSIIPFWASMIFLLMKVFIWEISQEVALEA